jgi:hypothetical protein
MQQCLPILGIIWCLNSAVLSKASPWKIF